METRLQGELSKQDAGDITIEGIGTLSNPARYHDGASNA